MGDFARRIPVFRGRSRLGVGFSQASKQALHRRLYGRLLGRIRPPPYNYLQMSGGQDRGNGGRRRRSGGRGLLPLLLLDPAVVDVVVAAKYQGRSAGFLLRRIQGASGRRTRGTRSLPVGPLGVPSVDHSVMLL